MFFFPLVAFTIILASAVPASAQDQKHCHIRDLDCYTNGKCNIKFVNNTNKQSSDGQGGEQVKMSNTITVSARYWDGSECPVVGDNRSISAGNSVTLNLSKKGEDNNPPFWMIRVHSKNDNVFGLTLDEQNTFLSCTQIRDIMEADASCHVFARFNSQKPNYYGLGVKCGSVVTERHNHYCSDVKSDDWIGNESDFQ